MQLVNKAALQSAITAFATALRNDDGKLITNTTLDAVLGDLIIDYNDGSTDIFPVVGSDGDPGDDGVSIIDVQFARDDEQGGQHFLQTTLSNGVVLQTLNPIDGYDGDSVTDVYLADNALVFTIGTDPNNTLTVPIEGLEPGNIESIRSENGNLIVTIAGGVELPPVPVDGITTNNPTGAKIEDGDLIFILEDGTEIPAGLVADLKGADGQDGRSIANVRKEAGVLYIEYSDAPGVEVNLGAVDGISDIVIQDGELVLQMDSGTPVNLGKYMVLTGALIRENHLILQTNQPGEEAELDLGPVADLKGDQGVGIKSVQIIDNEFIVTLTDDQVLPGLPVSELTPISVNGARWDETEGKLYLSLTDGSEIDTGMDTDIRGQDGVDGKGVDSVTFNSATGEITIQYNDDSPAVVLGTIPVVTDLSVDEAGVMTVTWSNDPGNPVELTTVKSVISIAPDETGQIVATFNTGETSNLGKIQGYVGAAIIGGQLQLTDTAGQTELIGRVLGDQGAPGLGFKDATLNAQGELILTRDDDVPFNAGPARTTTTNLVGRTQNVTPEAGQVSFAIDHGGVGTVLAFRNGDLIQDSDLDLTVNDTIGYANGSDLLVTDRMKFVIYVPGAASETGRGVFQVVEQGNNTYLITLEDGTDYTIAMTIPEDQIPAGLVGASVQANGDLILTFDKGDPINAGKANAAINTKNAYIDGDGILQIVLDDDSEIPAGNVVSDLTITDVKVNTQGELEVTLNTGNTFNAGPTGVYVTDANVDQNDVLQISLSDGRILPAGTVRNPLLGSRYDFVAFEGQFEFPVVHGGFEVMLYANGVCLAKDSLDLGDTQLVKVKSPRAENDVVTILLIGAGQSLAVGLSTENDAANETYYGKDETGAVGWHGINRIKFSQPLDFVIEAGQTTLNVLSRGLVNVFKNGLLLTEGYTVPSDNRRVVFEAGVVAEGDKVRVEVLQAPSSASDLLAGAYARVAYETFQAGGTFTKGDWRVRQMNTIVNDGIGVQLLNNRLVLPAGQYYIRGFGACSGVSQNALRLYNQTYGNVALTGGPSFAPRGNAGYDTPEHLTPISGYFTVASQSSLILQHICAYSRSTYGFGNASAGGPYSSIPLDALGIPGRLVDLEIWKVG